MATIIATDSRPFSSQTVQLGGRTYLLSLNWRTRARCWFLDLADVDEVPIVHGVKVVCQHPLLSLVADARRPIGELFALTGTTDTSPPGLDDFGPGKRVELWYFDASEL